MALIRETLRDPGLFAVAEGEEFHAVRKGQKRENSLDFGNRRLGTDKKMRKAL
jgi:hypothetical protein